VSEKFKFLSFHHFRVPEFVFFLFEINLPMNTGASAHSAVDVKQAKEREEKHVPNHLGHVDIPDLVTNHGNLMNPMTVAGLKTTVKGIGMEVGLVTAKGATDMLEEEFRWKELFASVQQRNEAPALLVYKSMPRDHLLEAQMEHFLETYIRRHLSPSKQLQLETSIRQKLQEIDHESTLLLEEVIKMLPADIAEDQCRTWWKANGFRNTIVQTLAKRYQVDPDTPLDRLGISLIRAIHDHHQQQIQGLTGPTGETGAPRYAQPPAPAPAPAHDEPDVPYAYYVADGIDYHNNADPPMQ
jgi:hypothetical protein